MTTGTTTRGDFNNSRDMLSRKVVPQSFQRVVGHSYHPRVRGGT